MSSSNLQVLGYKIPELAAVLQQNYESTRIAIACLADDFLEFRHFNIPALYQRQTREIAFLLPGPFKNHQHMWSYCYEFEPNARNRYKSFLQLIEDKLVLHALHPSENQFETDRKPKEDPERS